MKTCTVDDCQKKHTAKGMCQMHYRRNKLYNDPKLRPGRARKNTASINNNGYELLYEPENPNANVNGLVLVHRKVMSEVLGRPLLRTEQVHHKNGNRSDNRIENLEMWTTHQPQGQRIEDKIQYAIEILKQYAPHLLKENTNERSNRSKLRDRRGHRTPSNGSRDRSQRSSSSTGRSRPPSGRGSSRSQGSG